MSEKLTTEITGKGNAEQLKCRRFLISLRTHRRCVCSWLVLAKTMFWVKLWFAVNFHEEVDQNSLTRMQSASLFLTV